MSLAPSPAQARRFWSTAPGRSSPGTRRSKQERETLLATTRRPGARLEAACQRAVHLQSYSYRSVQSILTTELDQYPLPERTRAAGLEAIKRAVAAAQLPRAVRVQRGGLQIALTPRRPQGVRGTVPAG